MAIFNSRFLYHHQVLNVWMLTVLIVYSEAQVLATNSTVSCGGTTCSGIGYVDPSNSETRCWAPNGILSYCDTSSSTNVWTILTSSDLNYIPCSGYFNFTIVTGKYMLYGTNLLKWNGTTWNPLDASFIPVYTNYLARLRPNEGVGAFYCWAGVTSSVPGGAGPRGWQFTPNSWIAYYYNGSYFDLTTDSSTGNVITVAQTTQQYSENFFLPFATTNETGCLNPVCVWTQDLVNVTASGATTSVITETMYNGSLWYTWSTSSGSYQLYTGEFTNGITRVMNYFSSFSWKISNGTKYQFINGTLYQIGSNGKPAGVAPSSWSFWDDVDSDPLATGGFFYTWHQTTIGVWKNLTGDLWCNIQNGVMTYQRQPPSCDWGSVGIGNANPSCTQTQDKFPLTSVIVCDPLQSPSICGNGYVCVRMPSTILGLSSCSMGQCVPDFAKNCAPSSTSSTSTTTTTTTTTTTGSSTTTAAATYSAAFQKYGSKCTTDTDCYTGICTNNVCSCTTCTKILPSLQWDWPTQALVYRETCIPTTSTVGSLGDSCNMWASVRQQYCAFGLMCAKCPEVWNCAYANATCLATNYTGYVTGTCSSKCGYKANCTIISGTPVCICPTGYNLESDMINCYGWKVTDQGTCSATCGNGVRQITRTCDKLPTSSATCDGNATLSSSCSTGSQCSIPDSALSTAVYVPIQTKVLTVDLFDAYVKQPMSSAIAASINAQCLSNSTLYQTQCCPGKTLSSSVTSADCVDSSAGLTYMSEYSSGTTFSFYLTVVGNANSACCISGTSSTSGRRKRSASAGFDQSALAGVISSPTVISGMVQSVQSIDPNAAIQANSISVATTTQAPVTSSQAYVGLNSETASSSSGMAIWLVGVIAGCCAFVVVLVVVVLIVIFEKRRLSKIAASNRPTMPNTQVMGPNKVYGQPSQQMQMMNNSAVMNTQSSYNGFNSQQTTGQASYPPYYGRYPPDPPASSRLAPQPAYGY